MVSAHVLDNLVDLLIFLHVKSCNRISVRFPIVNHVDEPVGIGKCKGTMARLEMCLLLETCTFGPCCSPPRFHLPRTRTRAAQARQGRCGRPYR